MGTMSSRPGPRDELRAARHRMARRAVRQHRLCRARHGAGGGRRRLPFRPLDEAGDDDHRPGDRRDHRQGPQDRRRTCSRPARPTSNSSTAASASPAPTARSACSRWRRPRSTRKDLPEELQGPLGAISDQTMPVASFPYGTQVCEVEVDAETGAVDLVGYAAVDDVGRAINPLILHGQTHGGIAQGVGQALLENSHYDPASGQLLAATFMDYAMPRADTFPSFATALSEVPAPTNRLGVRSGGEGGTTPALAVGDQRDRRCAGRIRRAPYRDAGDARTGMARHPCGAAGSGRINPCPFPRTTHKFRERARPVLLFYLRFAMINPFPSAPDAIVS